MKVKVFQPNSQGKIEFTRAELEKLLNEVYDGGFRDGVTAQKEKSTWTWTSPYTYNNDLGTTTISSTNMPLTINSSVTQPIDKLTYTYDSATNKNDTFVAKNSTADVAPFSINLDDSDARSLSKAVNEIIANASRGARPSTGTLNAFDALAKELNF